jgi:hypothetical protein
VPGERDRERGCEQERRVAQDGAEDRAIPIARARRREQREHAWSEEHYRRRLHERSPT